MHRLMLKDEMLVVEAQRLIREERVNAEWAVKRAVRKIKGAFHAVADEYFKERRADVDFVGERVIKNLMGQVVDVDEQPPDGAIVVAHDLSPADTALLLHDRKVGAFVTDAGAKTSHTAIVARALEIPAVVGVGRVSTLAGRGDWIIVDGGRGIVVLNPSAGERADYEAARERYLEQERGPAPACGTSRPRPWTGSPSGSPATSSSPRRFRACSPTAARAWASTAPSSSSSAAGTCPTRRSTTATYRRVLEALAPRPVTIRTFDLGGDKMPASQRDHAENPALGLRAIRYCLRHPDMFRDQLRALLRAGVHGNLKVMFPMVSGVAELRAAKRMLDDVREELAREGVETRDAAGGDHGGDARRRHARRPAGARVRLLLDRHERPHPVHHRHRPAEQGRRLPLQAAAPLGAPNPALRLPGGAGRGNPGQRCAARWRASPSTPWCCSDSGSTSSP